MDNDNDVKNFFDFCISNEIAFTCCFLSPDNKAILFSSLSESDSLEILHQLSVCIGSTPIGRNFSQDGVFLWNSIKSQKFYQKCYDGLSILGRFKNVILFARNHNRSDKSQVCIIAKGNSSLLSHVVSSVEVSLLSKDESWEDGDDSSDNVDAED